MIFENILVVVFNHALNDKAIALKNQFDGLASVWLADSGSTLSPDQRNHFDATFPNIYYNGLMNELHRYLEKRKPKPLTAILIVTSDVTIPSAKDLLDRIQHAFENPEIAVYAPSCGYSYHPQMIHKPRRDLETVTFTEGFCFAFRPPVLNAICPIDVSLNKFGYGTDTIMGFHAMDLGCISVVDHQIKVEHPYGSGYDHKEAVIEKNTWYRSLSPEAYTFARFTTWEWTKNRFGAWLAGLLFRRR